MAGMKRRVGILEEEMMEPSLQQKGEKESEKDRKRGEVHVY
jgi:hypothetical protein